MAVPTWNPMFQNSAQEQRMEDLIREEDYNLQKLEIKARIEIQNRRLNANRTRWTHPDYV